MHSKFVLPLSSLLLSSFAQAADSPKSKKILVNQVDMTTVFGPRILTDDLQPMFGARMDHAFDDKVAGNITAGVTSDWGATVDGGTVTVGLDVHPFGGGLTGLWMGPRVTANVRDSGNQLNGKLLWGYNFSLTPGLLIGGGFGPGVVTDLDTAKATLVPAGEVVLSLSF